MAQSTFDEISNIQAVIRVTHAAGKDELFINISNDEPRIGLSIQENEEDEGSFQLHSAQAQRLFDWLKSKGIVS